jgi:hypothetical protein
VYSGEEVQETHAAVLVEQVVAGARIAMEQNAQLARGGANVEAQLAGGQSAEDQAHEDSQ